MIDSNVEHLKAVAKMITAALAVEPPKHQARKYLPDGTSFFINSYVKPINPIIQGSMALLLLGVDYKAGGFENPKDIDIIVANLAAAHNCMKGLQERLEKEDSRFRIELPTKKLGSPSVVNDYLIVDKTKENPDLLIQLVDVEDFGLITTKSIKKIEIPVLTPAEAMRGLTYAIKVRGARDKDKYAYTTMMELYHKEFTTDPLFSKDPEIKKYLRKFSQEEDRKNLKHSQDDTHDDDNERAKHQRIGIPK